MKGIILRSELETMHREFHIYLKTRILQILHENRRHKENLAAIAAVVMETHDASISHSMFMKAETSPLVDNSLERILRYLENHNLTSLELDFLGIDGDTWFISKSTFFCLPFHNPLAAFVPTFPSKQPYPFHRTNGSPNASLRDSKLLRESHGVYFWIVRYSR